MPAVAVVASLALSSVGITAASIGTALLGGTAAVAAIEGGTVIASVLGGAVIGTGTGALSAAVQGGDIGKGALMGAASGGIGGGISTAVGEALGASGVPGTAGYVKPSIGGSEALGVGVSKGLGGLAGGTSAALAGGQPLNSALKSGLIGGVSGGLSAGLGEGLGLGGLGSNALGGAISYGLGQAFKPSAQTRTASAQPAQTGATGFQTPATQAAGTSSALGSALFAAPGFSYSPVMGGSSGEDKAPKNVWSESDKSLRDVGSTVT
jgi:hypothetical protein